MSELNMSCLNQGKMMLSHRQRKTSNIKLREHNTIPGVETTRNITYGNIEGFTGAIGESAANRANAEEEAILNAVNSKMERALSDYTQAKKVLMEETAGFINSEKGAANAGNTSTMIGSVAGIKHQMKVVKWADNKMSVITDKGLVKPMSQEVWGEIKGKYGCPSSVQVNSEQSLGNPVEGQMLGTKPDYYVGSNMKPQGCHNSSGINARVMSASDPGKSKSGYAGTIMLNSGSGKNFEDQPDLAQSSWSQVASNTESYNLDLCASRAVDLGRTAWGLYRDGNGGTRCAIAPKGDFDKVWNARLPGITPKTNKILTNIDDRAFNSISMLYTGELAQSNIPSKSSLEEQGINFTDYAGNIIPSAGNISDSYPGLDQTAPPGVSVLSATYGGNCNGKINKEESTPAVVVKNSFWKMFK